ncbi:MAG: replication-associated recombination protein A, partial [Lachnospiraceae bacterium]|nr:replication-associated recombination protein A [Lachnospiraceae bacterium]
GAAMEEVRKSGNLPVPPHLRNANYEGEREMGIGVGYKYAHDFPGHYVAQQYLPDKLVGKSFFEPGELGYEERIRERLSSLGKLSE